MQLRNAAALFCFLRPTTARAVLLPVNKRSIADCIHCVNAEIICCQAAHLEKFTRCAQQLRNQRSVSTGATKRKNAPNVIQRASLL